MRSAALLSLATAVLAWDNKTIDTFYPDIVDPEAVVQTSGNSSYSAIPVGSVGGTPDTEQYGEYNYCFMPHPRDDTYELPAEKDAQIVALTYVQRHQKRSAYHTFPEGEDIAYSCSDFLPFLYGGPANRATQRDPVVVYASTYSDESVNPFSTTHDPNTTCQFPQLTSGGFADGITHGRDLWAVYGDKLGLLPKYPTAETVWLRSSTKALTQQSAGGVLRGLWPYLRDALPLHQQDEQIDSIGSNFPCDQRDAYDAAWKKSDEFKKHMEVLNPLQTKFKTAFKTNVSDWNSDWDHYNDNFQARLCNGYPLPPSVDDTAANTVFKAGDWEYNYHYVTQKNATDYIKLKTGVFIGELVAQLQQVVNGTSNIKYHHVFAHDGDVAPLTASLGIKTLRWPGMGSNVALELWKLKNEHYIRVLYSGQPIRSNLGDLSWIKFDDFVSKWTGQAVPKNVFEECKVGN